MDDELEWLRDAKPPTDGVGDLARRRARARLLAEATAPAGPDQLEPLPVAGAAPIDETVREPTSAESSSGRRRNRRALPLARPRQKQVLTTALVLHCHRLPHGR